ncbi:DUF1620-domain-containing protein [Piedraia hortae CBS 480.64]|uniref:ER membrane protein complex subunit 1 n=1 Tax=Piedraia hortae CBS 480.64 TaxID=1314780 RepID=A0A6A7BUP0_9PEZI|nr:DUF1620-domain-containing protein [Piedraia hortae CBS 480.64]
MNVVFPLLLLLSGAVNGIHSDEVGILDRHLALFGPPLEHSTFFAPPRPASPANLLYTLSEKQVFGAINPKNGDAVWRQRDDNTVGTAPHAGPGLLRPGRDSVLRSHGHGLAAWDAASGRLAFKASLHDEIVDFAATNGGDPVVALRDGTVERLGALDGLRVWTSRISGHVRHIRVADRTVFVIAHARGGMVATALDAETGEKKADETLGADNVVLGRGSVAVWMQKQQLAVHLLGLGKTALFKIDGADDVTQVKLHSGADAFLVHFESDVSHWAQVFSVTGNEAKKAYALPVVVGKGAFAASTAAEKTFFTRITEKEVLVYSATSEMALGRWDVGDLGVVAWKDETVSPLHAVSEVATRGDVVSAVRSAVWLSTGDWVMLRNGNVSWHRPEVLAETISASFVQLNETVEQQSQIEEEAHSNAVAAYVHRVKRHVKDLERLPGAVRHFFEKSEDPTDKMGFNPIVVCATEQRLIALDRGNLKTLWSRPLSVRNSTVSSPAGGIVQVFGTKYDASTGEEHLIDVSSPSTTFTSRDNTIRAQSFNASLWTFAPEENIKTISARHLQDPVASIGKVLGDRRVLYKYLDPNMAIIITAGDDRITATLLNTLSGQVLWSRQHTEVDTAAPMPAMVTENWFTYSFTSYGKTKGHQLVIGEAFESLIPNQRSEGNPVIITQAYQVPEPITHLSATRTRQGITSRQLLAVLPYTHAIAGIPFLALDPRRPVHRDPTKEELSEGLTRYNPVLEFNPKWYLSHSRDILGVKDVLAAPAIAESASLIFAYGLDIFTTRLAPSGKFDLLGTEFNKGQMLMTVAALGIATVAVRPLVQKRLVDGRWKFL